MSAASDRKKATTTKTAAKTITTAAGNNTKKPLQSGYKGTGTSNKSTGTTSGTKAAGGSMAGNSYSAALSGASKTDSTGSTGSTGSTSSTGSGNSYAAGYNENRLLQSGNKNTGGTLSGGISIPTSATTGGSYSSAGGSYGGYDNGGLTAEQIKQLQAYYGTDADGLWGANSTASAGGLSAQEAWQQYRQDLQLQQDLLNAQLAAQQQGQLYSDSLGGEMSWEQYLDKMGATDYQTKLQEAISAQVQQAVDDYNRQIEETGTNYEQAARRAYINNMLSRRNMDQELAASGVYGGMADSQRIAMEADYQNNLTDLETQYADTISQLEQAVTNARLSGDAQVAEQMAAYLSQVQGQYSNYLSQLQQERAAAALAAQQAQAQASLLAQENSYSTPSYYSSSGGSSGGSSYSDSSGGASTSGNTGTSGGSGAGVNNYAGVKNNILLYASRGMKSVANRLITQSWNEMNEAQQNDLVATMRQKGYIS